MVIKMGTDKRMVMSFIVFPIFRLLQNHSETGGRRLEDFLKVPVDPQTFVMNLLVVELIKYFHPKSQ